MLASPLCHSKAVPRDAWGLDAITGVLEDRPRPGRESRRRGRGSWVVPAWAEAQNHEQCPRDYRGRVQGKGPSGGPEDFGGSEGRGGTRRGEGPGAQPWRSLGRLTMLASVLRVNPLPVDFLRVARL